jgi:hypothetical protein
MYSSQADEIVKLLTMILEKLNSIDEMIHDKLKSEGVYRE